MEPSLLLHLITAFGLGSIITTLVQSFFARRSDSEIRSFQEKKESYIGLLQAYHTAAVEQTDTAAKNFAYWQMRCEMVSPLHVREAIEKIVDTNPNTVARCAAHENLKHALRRDLGISK